MTSSDAIPVAVPADDSPLLWRLTEVVRLGVVEFWATNPLTVIIGAISSRFVLQVLFFTMLGGAVDGRQQKEYAFVGGLVSSLALINVLYVSQVPVADKEFATFWRLRMSRLPPMLIFLARSLPYPLLGFGLVVVADLVVGPLTGMGALAVHLLPSLGLFLLISLTATAAGIAAAAASVGRTADAMASNLMGYTIMLCSGAFLPPGQVAALDAVGSILPARHGLSAIHAQLEGRPWGQSALAEAGVGLLWLAIGLGVVAMQIRRAQVTGNDDFA